MLSDNKKKKKQQTMLTLLNIKSFHRYHKQSFLSVATYILFLSNFYIQINHLQQEAVADALSIDPQHNATQLNNSRGAVNYLLFSSSNQTQDSKINELLMDSNHNHASDAVNIQLANSVWVKLRKNVQEFAKQRTQQARPIINKLLQDANVTLDCEKSLNSVLDRIDQLDNWAMEMYNAFSDFPSAGLFEGSLTAMGSYHQCVNLAPNDWIERAQYCTFKFQPIIPKRPRYHNILATIDNLANFTSKDDVFYHLAKKAQYFWYTKLRFSTCMPTKCKTNDIELLGKQVALNTYIQFAGVSCLEKEVGYNLDGGQIFAITILISLASISFLGTIVHLFNLRSFIITDNGHSSSTKTTNIKTSTMNTDLTCKQNNIKNHRSSIILEQEQLQQKQKLLDQQQQQPEEEQALQRSVILNHHDHQDDEANQAIIISSGSISSHDSIDRSSTPINSIRSASNGNDMSLFKLRLLYIIDVLLHFSIVKNGKKLFDTRTSRHASHRRKNKNKQQPLTMANNDKNQLNNINIMRDSISTESSESSSISESSRTDCSTTTAVNGPSNQASDISCVHGLRFWTISWIIFGHTMQYTEWAGMGRLFQVEENITSFFLHPVLNATFSVDTFFLISGLLTTYVTWSMSRGEYKRFNKFAFLVSRYLRLTPQVLLVILLFIIFPLLGDGPYWRGLIQKESDNCKKNWWINALYLQAFVKQDQICNLVTWWLSIEMFYHLVSILVIIALLHSTKKGLIASVLIGGGLTGVSCYLHFVNEYPPNMLPTLLQRYEIWDSIVLKYFWTPFPHAPSYFVGLLLGYLLYNKSVSHLTKRQVYYGWLAFTVCYLSILFGTYRWNKNEPYSKLTSTVYYIGSQVLWSFATGWAILACALGYGGCLNSFLSKPIFVPLGRATYMTYLSHMIIVMSYPAKMNTLIEPGYTVFLYIFLSNLILSYGLGIFLTLVYESPILHLQKILVTNMAQKFVSDETSSTITNRSSTSSSSKRNSNRLNNQIMMDSKMVKVSLFPEKVQQQQQQQSKHVDDSVPC